MRLLPPLPLPRPQRPVLSPVLGVRLCRHLALWLRPPHPHLSVLVSPSVLQGLGAPSARGSTGPRRPRGDGPRPARPVSRIRPSPPTGQPSLPARRQEGPAGRRCRRRHPSHGRAGEPRGRLGGGSGSGGAPGPAADAVRAVGWAGRAAGTPGPPPLHPLLSRSPRPAPPLSSETPPDARRGGRVGAYCYPVNARGHAPGNPVPPTGPRTCWTQGTRGVWTPVPGVQTRGTLESPRSLPRLGLP